MKRFSITSLQFHFQQTFQLKISTQSNLNATVPLTFIHPTKHSRAKVRKQLIELCALWDSEQSKTSALQSMRPWQSRTLPSASNFC